ncbi:MAG: tyrosine-type recombinase/integrase [Candidatus Phlomobacter fragariae]
MRLYHQDIIVNNTVLPAKTPKIKIQKARLSFNYFNAILNLINDENNWLSHTMKLALVTGQRVSDIAKMKCEDIHDEKLWIIQQKIGTKIAIPLNIEIKNFKLRKILGSIDCVNRFIITINNKILIDAAHDI